MQSRWKKIQEVVKGWARKIRAENRARYRAMRGPQEWNDDTVAAKGLGARILVAERKRKRR